ncbi:hypothetical protein KW783_03630 [Candidatus Parcubacteria bacterium]|nr:hypothetical protein [Candidatus Parcubacteria bacterium]
MLEVAPAGKTVRLAAAHVTPMRAKEILGDHLFGPNEWKNRFGHKLTEAQQRMSLELPFPEKELIEKRKTHFSFLSLSCIGGLRLTIADLLRVGPFLGIRGDHRFLTDDFSRNCCESGWHLLPLKSSGNESTPAILEVMKFFLYRAINDRWPCDYAPTSDSDSHGIQIVLKAEMCGSLRIMTFAETTRGGF